MPKPNRIFSLAGLLLGLAAGPSCSQGPGRLPAEEPLRLVLFAGEGLPLADSLRSELLTAELAFEELSPTSDLFERAFGTPGRLGLAWIDGEGRVLSVLPGASPIGEVRLRDRLVRARLASWRDSGALERVRIQLSLRAEAPAEQDLRALLAQGEDPQILALLARALARRGSIQECLETCARAEQVDRSMKSDPELLLTRALARIASREPERALELLEGLVGDEEHLARGLALHHAEQGAPLDELKLVLDRYPLSPWRAAARDQIEHILSPPEEHNHR